VSWLALKRFCLGVPEYGLNVPAESYTPEGLRFIRTTDVTERGGLTPAEDAVFIDPNDADPSSRLQDGDLLFSRSGTLGRALLYRRGMEQATFAGYLVRFRPRPENDPRYIYYCSLADFFQNTVRSEAVSSTISNFNAERYANLRLPWCIPSKQRAIADFLDAETARIDALIAKKRRMRQLLGERITAHVEQKTRASSISMVEDDPLPEKWRSVVLRRCFELIQYGIGEASREVGTIAVLGMGNVDHGEIVGNPGGFVDQIDPSLLLEPGDLLFNRTNSLALVGKVALVRDSTATTFASYPCAYERITWPTVLT